ncbi:histidine ammonia-lyase [bacterium]|nr:histidine ammonia-lyase [bacterium]
MELADHHSIEEIISILNSTDHVLLSQDTQKRIERCNHFLLDKIKWSEDPIYGVNTGFGALYNKEISEDQLAQLQVNLLRSHACGIGDEVPQDIVKIMLILKAKSLSKGHSGVQLKTVEKLLDLYNAGILPVVYEQGSLGASGDLAPLAHLALALIGEGQVNYEGHKAAAKDCVQETIELGPKEGLALINGTQFMQAYGVYCLDKAQKLMKWADLLAACSLDAYDGRIEPFWSYSHSIRPHKGQVETAAVICDLLQGSEIIKRKKQHVQDPYSFRCVPQVHGASKDAIRHAKEVFETEINAVTDNPNVFPDEDLVLSAGNFHGQPLALQLDFLAIAIAEIGSISERRVYRLLEGKRELPAFLTANAGLNSGLMIAQYTAASIVSQNKQLCTPASVDTIESSNGQEDHVSMGANAATKCLRVLENVEKVLAIELITAAKAMAFRRPLKSSSEIEKILAEADAVCDLSDRDILLSDEMHKAQRFIADRVI